MHQSRVARLALACIASLIAGLASPALVLAQGYPAKDIQFVTTGSPGNTSDLMTRVMADELQKTIARNVIVVNRPGGSGLAAANATLAMPADGHALFLGTMGTLTINPFVMASSMPFDSMAVWTPIALAASMPLALVVNPEVTKATNLKELVDLARAQPGRLTYGSAGAGSSMAITAAMLGKQAGVSLTHVPYKTINDGVSAVLGREVTMMVPDVGLVTARLREGRLTALGVTTAARSSLLPAVPTMKEQGYEMDVAVWYGVFVRAETPRPAVDRLVAEFRTVLASPTLKQRWQQMELTVGDKIGAEFDRFYKAEYKRWGEAIKALDLKIQ